jgi:hypothetical protein
MDPAEDGVILPAELSRPGRGVVGTVGDQGESEKAFASAGMVRLKGEAPQVVERLSPLLHLEADHEDALPSDADSRSPQPFGISPSYQSWRAKKTPGFQRILV